VSDVIREQRGANYMGFEVVEPDGGTRREPKVIRGNGELTLTSSELRFVRWIPKLVIVIALDSVSGVEVGKSHNGKWVGFHPVVKVRFAGPDGERILGVLVGGKKEASAWAEAIRGAIAA